MDLKIAVYINHLFKGTFVDQITYFTNTIYFLTIFWLIVALIAMLYAKGQAKLILLSLTIGIIIYFVFNDLIIKDALANIFGAFRSRPWVAHPDPISPIGKLYTESSMPSGHVASTLTILTIVVYFYRKIWIYALIFALFIGFSRIHNGMHYPTDVLVGAVSGILYGLMGIVFAKRLLTPNKK